MVDLHVLQSGSSMVRRTDPRGGGDLPFVRIDEDEGTAGPGPGTSVLPGEAGVGMGMLRTQSTSALRMLRRKQNRFSFYEDQSRSR